MKISAGSHEAPTIKVVSRQDNVFEETEDLKLEITNPDTNNTDYKVKTDGNIATGHITDDGDKPKVSIEAIPSDAKNKAIEGEKDDILEYQVKYDNKTSKFDSVVHVKPDTCSCRT